MVKRDEPPEDEARPHKRQRYDFAPPQVEEVHFARQLQECLAFQQDGLQRLRNGIASFKAFLETILYRKEDENRARQVSILREYLESQKPPDATDLERPFLAQLWQAWSFAGQNHNDHLVSSVSAVLALLLKTLSGILDLREHGVLLCRTTLQNQHLRLLKRSLDAPKHKDFVISPALRLLTEVVAFDGGLLAREVYRRREYTFDVAVLRRLLTLVKTEITEEEARRKPALRTLGLRYVLSLLKYLHEGGKIDLLKARPICNALFQHLHDDPSDVVSELLGAIEQSVFKDAELPRSSKAAILTPQNLERVTRIATRSEDAYSASQKAFSWLRTVCTTPEYGVLRKGGWYPPGTTKPEHDPADIAIDLGLDSLESYDRVRNVHVRNPVLLAWIQTLRPHVNERERELLLACFTAAPELVAAYFSEHSMQLDPKLSNTWIGYASVLFEVVSLPVPASLDGEEASPAIPPQTVILIENILPRPLTQAILTRCLNQNSDLITFFATRILIVAFEKLRAVLDRMRASMDSGHQALWTEARDRLIHRFTERAPSMKDVVNTFRRIPDDEEHALQREAVARLLLSYYNVTPARALTEQLDISIALTAALLRADAHGKQSTSVDRLRRLELEHLLSIARYSPGMKWFNKQGSLLYSPVATLLRIHRHEPTDKQIASLLDHVLVEHFLLNQRPQSSQSSPLDALVASTVRLADDSSVWRFLDDWLLRGSRKPVKYLDDLTALVEQGGDSSSSVPSLLAAVVLEQTPFIKAQPEADQDSLISWIETFLALLSTTFDGGNVLKSLSKAIRKLYGRKPRKIRTDDLATLVADWRRSEQLVPVPPSLQAPHSEQPRFILPFKSPTPEPDSHPELIRWSQKDVSLAIEDGDISGLIFCLCSAHLAIRTQAAAHLHTLHLSLRTSPEPDSREQLSLLLGELLATFRLHYLSSSLPLPHIAAAFAVSALNVLLQPSHPLYPKLNRFLLRGPEWRLSRLPGYWLANTIHSLPADPDLSDAYWQEVQWVLDWLVAGLVSPADLDLYLRSSVFERVFALSFSPAATSRTSLRTAALELVFRASGIERGAELLVQRCGVTSYLSLACNGEMQRALQLRLDERIGTGGDPDLAA